MALIAHWPLDGRLDDISGNGYDLIFYNNNPNPTSRFKYTNGAYNGRVFYRGDGLIDSLVVADNKFPLNLCNKNVKNCKFSVLFRYKMEKQAVETGRIRTIFKVGENAHGFQLQTRIAENNGIYILSILSMDKFSRTYRELVTLELINDIVSWHTYSIIFNGETIEIFINETRVYRDSVDTSHTFDHRNKNWFSLGNRDSFKEPMCGFLENFMVFDHVLTGTEIYEYSYPILFEHVPKHNKRFVNSLIDTTLPTMFENGGTKMVIGTETGHHNPFGYSAITYLSIPVESDTGFYNCRATSKVKYTMKPNVKYSSCVYIKGDIDFFTIYVTGGHGMMNPFKHRPEYDIDGWQCFVYENASINVEALNYLTFYASKTPHGSHRSIYVAYHSMEEGEKITPPNILGLRGSSYLDTGLYKQHTSLANTNLPSVITYEGLKCFHFTKEHNEFLHAFKSFKIPDGFILNIKFKVFSFGKWPRVIDLSTDKDSLSQSLSIGIRDNISYIHLRNHDGSVYLNKELIEITINTMYELKVSMDNSFVYVELNQLKLKFNIDGWNLDPEIYVDKTFIGGKGYNIVDTPLHGVIYEVRLVHEKKSRIKKNVLTTSGTLQTSEDISLKTIEVNRNLRYSSIGSRGLKVLKSIKKHTYLYRSEQHNDAYSNVILLPTPIEETDTVFIEFDTVISSSLNQTLDMSTFEIFFLNSPNYHNGYPTSLKFTHHPTDGSRKKHTVKYKNPTNYTLNFYRFDLNINTNEFLIENFRISHDKPTTNITNSEIIHRRFRKPDHNLLNYNDWEANTMYNTQDFYRHQGGSNFVNKILSVNPWGEIDVIWTARGYDNPASPGGNGGFDSKLIDIDPSKKYRISCWFRRDCLGYFTGSLYFGTNRNRGADDTLVTIHNNADQINPYFHVTPGLENIVDNDWVLFVAYVYPHTNTLQFIESIDNGGIYDTRGNKLIETRLSHCYKFKPTTRVLYMRSYLYYSKISATEAYFYRPRIDLCDSNNGRDCKTSIEDLCFGREHSSRFYDSEHKKAIVASDFEFIETKHAHGAYWGKIFYHCNNSGTVLFDNLKANFLLVDEMYMKSILIYLPKMRNSNDEYEFLLEYDSFEGYNRWIQTSIFTSEPISGYKPINISWDGANWGGLEPNTIPANSWCDGAVGSDNYRFAIGAKVNFNNAIPGPAHDSVSMNETRGVHLWIRITEASPVVINKDKILVNEFIENTIPEYPNAFISTKIYNGARYGKIFHHNHSSGKILFSDDDKSREHLSSLWEDHKLSLLLNMERYRLNGKYTFILEYDDFSGHIVWEQSTNFTKCNTVEDFILIENTIAEADQPFNGLIKYNFSKSTYFCGYLPGNSEWWYYAIGATKLHGTPAGIPGPASDPKMIQGGIHLWVKIPD